MNETLCSNLDLVLSFLANVRRSSSLYLANVNSRSLSFTFARYRRPSVRLSVCLSSITFVHPTQAIEILGNVSTPFGTLAICDPSVKILRRSSEGNPSVGGGGLNQRGVENVTILDLSRAISRKRCKIGGKLLLMTNRKSHMSFRLVPNAVTLNDLERHNRPNGCVISSNSVAFWADCVKVVEDTRILSAAEM